MSNSLAFADGRLGALTALLGPSVDKYLSLLASDDQADMLVSKKNIDAVKHMFDLADKMYGL